MGFNIIKTLIIFQEINISIALLTRFPKYTTYPKITPTMISNDGFDLNPIPKIRPNKKIIALALY